MTNKLISAQKSPELLDYLLHRRSAKITTLQAPGPTKAEIEQIITAAARVPDHGKLAPWYFIIFEGENREKIKPLLAAAYQTENPEAAPPKSNSKANSSSAHQQSSP